MSGERRCGVCETVGHDRRNCPDLDRQVDFTVEMIASLRERKDALTVEISEYEKLRAEIDSRITADKAEIMDIDRNIEKARAERNRRAVEVAA